MLDPIAQWPINVAVSLFGGLLLGIRLLVMTGAMIGVADEKDGIALHEESVRTVVKVLTGEIPDVECCLAIIRLPILLTAHRFECEIALRPQLHAVRRGFLRVEAVLDPAASKR